MLNFTKEEKLVLVFFVGCFALGSATAFFKQKEVPKYPLKTALFSETACEDGKVNINNAGLGELIRLKGIGPKTAMRIIGYRRDNGPFFCKEDLMNIKGIGRTKFESIKDRVVTK